MSNLIFPNNPSINDIHEYGRYQWLWDGQGWILNGYVFNYVNYEADFVIPPGQMYTTSILCETYSSTPSANLIILSDPNVSEVDLGQPVDTTLTQTEAFGYNFNFSSAGFTATTAEPGGLVASIGIIDASIDGRLLQSINITNLNLNSQVFYADDAEVLNFHLFVDDSQNPLVYRYDKNLVNDNPIVVPVNKTFNFSALDGNINGNPIFIDLYMLNRDLINDTGSISFNVELVF